MSAQSTINWAADNPFTPSASLTQKKERVENLIEQSNREKKANAPAVVILQTSFDSEGAFEPDEAYLCALASLGTTYYLHPITLLGGNVGKKLTRAKKQLPDHPIEGLIFRAHGRENAIQFGNEISSAKPSYQKEDVSAEDFSGLNLKWVISDSCCTGAPGGIADKIAQVTTAEVFAPLTISNYTRVLVRGEKIEARFLNEAMRSVTVRSKRKKEKVVRTLLPDVPQTAFSEGKSQPVLRSDTSAKTALSQIDPQKLSLNQRINIGLKSLCLNLFLHTMTGFRGENQNDRVATDPDAI